MDFRDFDHDGLCTRSQRQGTAERCEEVSQGLNESVAEAIEKRRRTVENLRPELLLQRHGWMSRDAFCQTSDEFCYSYRQKPRLEVRS